MKSKPMIALLIVAGLLTGCSDIVSLNAPIQDSEAVIDASLEGIYAAGEDVCIIRKPVGGVYRILYSEAPEEGYPGTAEARQFEGRLMKTQSAEVLDVVSDRGDEFHAPVHLWARVWPGAKELRWSWLDSEWLKGRARAELGTQETDSRMILTSPASTLRSFIDRYAGDEQAHGAAAIWERIR